MAGERAARRLVRGAERAPGQERAEPGEGGEATPAHGVHLSGVQQQPHRTHLQCHHPRPQP